MPFWKTPLKKLRAIVPKRFEESFDELTSDDLEHVLCYMKPPTNETVDEETWSSIRQALRSQIVDLKVDLKLEEVSSLPPDPTVISIVVCLVTDRVEASIDRTLREVQCRSNMLLLVLHHSAPHNHSNPETKARLTRAQFDQLGDVIDLKFWLSEGLYECNTNRTGLSALVRFLKLNNNRPYGGKESTHRPATESLEKVKSNIPPPRSSDEAPSPESHVTRCQAYTVTCYVKLPTNDTRAKDNWDVIKQAIQAHIKDAKVDLVFEEVSSLLSDPSATSIIVCHVTDKLEASIDQALREVQCRKNMVLLVVHHSAPDNQSNPDTKALLGGSEFDQLGDVIDLKFWHLQGLYECDTNITGLSGLVRFLKQGSLRTSQDQPLSSMGLKGAPNCDSVDTSIGKGWEIINRGDVEIGHYNFPYGDERTQLNSVQLQKQRVECFVKIAHGTNLMGVDRELWSRVKSGLQSDCINLIVTETTELTGACGHSTKTLILCPVTSRLGSNAAHAMMGVKGDKNMAMVCFHHIAPHVTFQDDSQLVLQDEKFQRLGAIVDVLFWEGIGMYDCPVNKSALSKIRHFMIPDSYFQPMTPSTPKPTPTPKTSSTPETTSLECLVKMAPGTNLMGVDRELLNKVKSGLQSGIDLRVTRTTEVTGARGHSAKTLILCPVTSRLGSNAAHAMKGVNGDKNMALVCFHHIAPHVTYQDDSQLVLHDEKFQRLGAIVDVLFWGGIGMYDCLVNQTALSKICSFMSWGIDRQLKTPSTPENTDCFF